MILKPDERKVLTLDKCIPTLEAVSYAITFLFSAVLDSLTFGAVIERSVIGG